VSGLEKLKQQLEKKAKDGFTVWHTTVEMTKGEGMNGRELSAKIKEIRKQKIWLHIDDVLALLVETQKTHVLIERKQLEEFDLVTWLDQNYPIKDKEWHSFGAGLVDTLRLFIEKELLDDDGTVKQKE